MSVVMETELGIERRCNKCGEWWPLDAEFYHRHAKGVGGFAAVCIDCRTKGTGRKRHLDEARIHLLIQRGWTVPAIAAAVGCSVGAVYKRKAAA